MANYTERDINSLYRILDFCDQIYQSLERFSDDKNIFLADDIFRDALKMKLFQIGETTNRISDACKEQIPEVEWHSIYGLRNIIAHGYEKIKDEEIWKIAHEDVQKLRETIISKLIDWGEDGDL